MHKENVITFISFTSGGKIISKNSLLATVDEEFYLYVVFELCVPKFTAVETHNTSLNFSHYSADKRKPQL